VPKIVGFLGGFPGNFWADFRRLLCWFCVSDLATLFVVVYICREYVSVLVVWQRIIDNGHII